jgi:hypothetical protein
MDAGGEIAILVIGSVTSVGPWLLEKSGVVIPRIVYALLGLISIAAFSWGMTKLLWLAAPNKLRFVTISGPGLIILGEVRRQHTYYGQFCNGRTIVSRKWANNPLLRQATVATSLPLIPAPLVTQTRVTPGWVPRCRTKMLPAHGIDSQEMVFLKADEIGRQRLLTQPRLAGSRR